MSRGKKTDGATRAPRPTPSMSASPHRLQLVTASEEIDLTPDEITKLIELAGREPQTIAEMEDCWARLRASYRAKERLQNLTPSEISAALEISKRTLSQPLTQPTGSAMPKGEDQ